jgi:UDP-2,3-diacylglucosamine pyrophosphatase LpxH
MLSIGVIGDPHFKTNNVKEMKQFVQVSLDYLNQTQPDLIVILGDILDRHANIHVEPQMMAEDYIEKSTKIAHTIVIIGNHDRKDNFDFLTTIHPFNALKKWPNLDIVDQGLVKIIKGFTLAFIPYVPPGRFKEAYDKIVGNKRIDLIFAHQEFSGCVMNSITSKDGDNWDCNMPFVISGHIHQKQELENVLYVGTPIQHEFGDDSNKGLHLIKLTDNDMEIIFKKLNIYRKITKTIKASEIYNFEPPENCDLKLTIVGTSAEIKALSISDLVRNLRKKCKVDFDTQSIISKTHIYKNRNYLSNLLSCSKLNDRQISKLKSTININ